MKNRGFSLIELLIVIGIAGILMAIATLQFNTWTRKSGIESQVNTLYSDMMAVKTEAFFRKQARLVVFTANQMTVYPSNVTTDAPVQQKTFSYPLSADSVTQVEFDTSGMASSAGALCIAPAGNAGAFDSVIVTATRIQTGKWSGGGCSSGNIVIR